MGRRNLPIDVTNKIIAVLQEERNKLIKSLENIDLEIAEYGEASSTPNIHKENPAVNQISNNSPSTRGSVGWKDKIEKALYSDIERAMPAGELVDKILKVEPTLKRAIAIKSIGSALSQNSNSAELSKNRYLFVKKHGIKYYYLNKDYAVK
jgi:hypothetical protein